MAATLLAVACSGSRTTVRTAHVASPSEALTCAAEQGEEMGFDVVLRDEDDRRLILERTDESVSRSDPTFQRAVDQLTAEQVDTEPGARPALGVEARTFLEFFNRRGRTRRQVGASAEVVAAAEELLDRCGLPGSSGEAGAAGPGGR